VVAKRYRITRAIGAGGMGTVYEALDLQTGCTVALKALTRVDRGDVALQRLRREAETAVMVRSNHVCHVHYLGVEAGRPFIVMERLHGETLRARLKGVGTMPVQEALSITFQLLDALSATHATGVVHRDVKPSNIFITSARGAPPRVKLIDFGVAKLLRVQDGPPSSAHAAMDITAPNGIPGTLQYLAPEQLCGMGDIDERVDVYAAGLALFEMLAGSRLYSGPSLDEVVRRIIFEAPPSISPARPDVPPLVDDVLAMALAKDPRRRFISAAAFHRALSTACEGQITAPRMPFPVTSEGCAAAANEEDITDLHLSIDLFDE
jgi:serine/threonine-protein kinase